MAQPRAKLFGVASRYHLYASSSPVICVANALSMLVRLIAYILLLPVGFRGAANLVIIQRSDDPCEDSKPPEGKAWPRYLFFVLGVLPAGIKLVSFTGTPWNQAWGLMFGYLFFVTELIGTSAQSLDSEPILTEPDEVQNLDPIETCNDSVAPLDLSLKSTNSFEMQTRDSVETWIGSVSRSVDAYPQSTNSLQTQNRAVETLVGSIARSLNSQPSSTDSIESQTIDGLEPASRSKAKSGAPASTKLVALNKKLEGLDARAALLALLFHMALICYATAKMWLIFFYSSDGYLCYRLIPGILQVVVGMNTLFAEVTFFYAAWSISTEQRRVRQWVKYWLWSGAAHLAATYLVLEQPKSFDQKSGIAKFNEKCTDVYLIWFYILMICWIAHLCMSRICGRWPVVARVLLLDAEPASSQHVGEQGRGGKGKMRKERIDYGAWVSFCMFLISFVTCVLWYAFMYDESGTKNPSWTDVFG